ncbi:mechanosensitive ion channel family protein [bacterium]|nr:mechanosensitive ion channel family protein [candidate division CSSED10-310 bacterium]
MRFWEHYINISPESRDKFILTIAILLILILSRILISRTITRYVTEARREYRYRRILVYTFTMLLILLIGPVWIRDVQSVSTFLGLASAGLAIAMHDTIANVTGWLFIVWRKPFKVGDRIQIGETAGDVIDIRLFQFSLVEIGNWVDADQSTGRIVHVPNSKVLREPLSNYHIGFAYIWNEIPVLITFESDWQKAKTILTEISRDSVEHLSEGAREQIRKAAEKFLIFYGTLTPIVYTSVKESGVLLTIRYFVDPRQRRSSEQHVWEAILRAFSKEPDISLAYPTTRFYKHPEPPSCRT